MLGTECRQCTIDDQKLVVADTDCRIHIRHFIAKHRANIGAHDRSKVDGQMQVVSIDASTAHIQHMQTALTFVAGERDPDKLATMRDTRCKESAETIRNALVGNYQPEHVFALKQALALYDFYQQCIDECDVEIERTVAALNGERQIPDAPLPKQKHRTKQRSEPNFDVRSAMYQLAGTELTQIHGIGPFLALRLIGECGTDLSRWPTAKHFTSWLTLSRGCKISGGRVLSAHTRKTSSRITVALRLAAVTVGRSNTAQGAFYRRLASRIGNVKAVTATARKIAVLFYNAMRYGMDYRGRPL